MPLEVSIQGIGFEHMRRQLKKINRDLERNTRTMRKIGDRMQRRTEQRIAQNRTPEGKKFKALKQSTIEDKQRRGVDSGKALIESGSMHRSFRTTIRPRLSGSRITIEPTDRENQFKARLHQFGTSHMPAREFLGFSAFDLKLMERELDRHMKRVVERHTRSV